MEKQTLDQKVDRILFYFESDPKTKRVGLVEQTNKNTDDISIMKTEKKVMWGKIGVASFILGSIGGMLIKIFLK